MSKGPHAKHRRAARLGAVQALYQMDVGGTLSTSVVKEFIEHRFGLEGEEGYIAADEEFFSDIVEGVVKYQEDVDKSISDNLSVKWTLKRLDLTLRAIMRCAGYEILRRPDVPALVIIDQYVSIAADFFEGKEPGFVNGALDKMAKAVRAAEFGMIGGPSASHG